MVTPLVTRRSLLGARGASGNVEVGECSVLQGLAGVALPWSPIPYLRTGIPVAEPAVTHWSPGDKLWVLPRVGEPALLISARAQGLHSSSEVKEWLRKPRVDKGTVLLPPSDVTCSMLPRDIPAELSHPSRQWKCSPPRAGLGEAPSSLPEDDPCSRRCPSRSLCCAPKPRRALAVPWPGDQSPLVLAQESSEPMRALLVLEGHC